VPIGTLDAGRIRAQVCVSGEVVDVASFSRGFKFTLDDGTGQITLLTWLEVFDRIVGSDGLRNGASVRVTGEIAQFEGELQITPFDSTDVVILSAGSTAAPKRDSGSLAASDVGSWVQIEGQVVRTDTFSSGLRVYLDDGSGQVLLLLWQNVLERLAEGGGPPTKGSWLRATGKVEEYQGALEVALVLPSDLKTIRKAAVSPTAPPNVVLPIGELNSGRLGEIVTISGRIMDTASFSEGFKFTVDDGSGRIVLLMWHNIYDACTDAPKLNIGAEVCATGEISEFEGELQIEPARGDDVEVATPSDSSPMQIKTGSIGAYLGQRITIVGQVTRIEKTGSATMVFIDDATGEALVYIWDNVLERVPEQQTLLRPGTQVRVTGLVQEYRGALEVVPALPYDVKVLE
jgi:DNA/RNA endonuclease YhcR with UshA esterase domain